MAITKYERVEKMPLPERVAREKIGRRLDAALARMRILTPPIVQRGVRRFGSVAEAYKARQAAEQQRARELARMRASRAAEG